MFQQIKERIFEEGEENEKSQEESVPLEVFRLFVHCHEFPAERSFLDCGVIRKKHNL